MTYPRLTYAAQVMAAVILLMASAMKFVGNVDSVEVFVRLGMEPGGRYLIAVIEALAALLLLSPLAALGSVIAVGVMSGAIIAHATQLGLSVNNDGGLLGRHPRRRSGLFQLRAGYPPQGDPPGGQHPLGVPCVGVPSLGVGAAAGE